MPYSSDSEHDREIFGEGEIEGWARVGLQQDDEKEEEKVVD